MRNKKFFKMLFSIVSVASMCLVSLPVNAAPLNQAVDPGLIRPVSYDMETGKILMEMFDAEYYAKQNPDVVAALGNDPRVLFDHFLSFGFKEGRQINKDFNVCAYAIAYPDLAKTFGTDVASYYKHYYNFGIKEKRELTNIEKCVAAGFDERTLRSQQLKVDDSGNAVFTQYFDSKERGFVLPKIETHDDDEDESEPEVKPEVKPFNQAAYGLAVEKWFECRPRMYVTCLSEKGRKDYEYLKQVFFNETSGYKACLNEGKIFLTQEEAEASYNADLAAWNGSDPKPEASRYHVATEYSQGNCTNEISDYPGLLGVKVLRFKYMDGYVPESYGEKEYAPWAYYFFENGMTEEAVAKIDKDVCDSIHSDYELFSLGYLASAWPEIGFCECKDAEMQSAYLKDLSEWRANMPKVEQFTDGKDEWPGCKQYSIYSAE